MCKSEGKSEVKSDVIEALDFAYSVFGDSAIYYSDFSGNAGRYGCIWIERNINIWCTDSDK